MSAELKFEYSQRRQQLLQTLLNGSEEAKLRAIQDIESGDRELEDYLANLQSGGGTAQSIIAVAESSHGHDDDSVTSNTFVMTDISFSVPATAGLRFYVEWDIHGSLLLNGTASDYVFIGYAQIQEHSPGAGFEGWGWHEENFSHSLDSVRGPNALTGHGHRIEEVTGLTTATLYFVASYSNIASQRVRLGLAYSAKLIAVPTGGMSF